MDIETKPTSQKEVILQAAKAARTYAQEIEGRSFTLQMPSQHDMRVNYLRAGADADDPALVYLVLRESLEKSLVGWSGITVDDLLKNGDKSSADFNVELVPVLLDAQDDWREALDKELTKRLAERNGSIEAAQKN